jgi:hypothetical protein
MPCTRKNNMKITKRMLKNIVREELNAVVQEDDGAELAKPAGAEWEDVLRNLRIALKELEFGDSGGFEYICRAAEAMKLIKFTGRDGGSYQLECVDGDTIAHRLGLPGDSKVPLG